MSEGNKVRGALDAPEAATEGVGQAAGQGGLADARHVFYQHVPAAQDGGQGQFDNLPLSHQDLLDAGLDGGGHGGHAGSRRFCVRRIRS